LKILSDWINKRGGDGWNIRKWKWYKNINRKILMDEKHLESLGVIKTETQLIWQNLNIKA
jgi:hypothetical protein